MPTAARMHSAGVVKSSSRGITMIPTHWMAYPIAMGTANTHPANAASRRRLPSPLLLHRPQSASATRARAAIAPQGERGCGPAARRVSIPAR